MTENIRLHSESLVCRQQCSGSKEAELESAKRRRSQRPLRFASASNTEINSSVEQTMQDFIRLEVLRGEYQARVRRGKTRQARKQQPLDQTLIKPDSAVRNHIKVHLLEMVERHTFLRNGEERMRTYDLASRMMLNRRETERRYGKPVICVAKSQLSRAELKRFGLTNSAFAET